MSCFLVRSDTNSGKNITLEPNVRLRFFKKGKCSELNFRNFWPGSRHLRPCPDRPDPISSLTELLSTHPINRFLSNRHSLLNPNSGTRRRIEVFKKKKMIRIEFPKLVAWFQTPQTVSRPSRPNFQPRKDPNSSGWNPSCFLCGHTSNSGTRRRIEIFKKKK